MLRIKYTTKPDLLVLYIHEDLVLRLHQHNMASQPAAKLMFWAPDFNCFVLPALGSAGNYRTAEFREADLDLFKEKLREQLTELCDPEDLWSWP